MQENFSKSGVLSIDLNVLVSNYSLFKQKVGDDCIVAGVVKADAYGLGLQPVVSTLLQNGCTHFFVATLQEALNFRSFEKDASIAVLGGLFIGAEDEYLHYNIQPVLNSPDDLKRWNALADKNKTTLPAILHIDTGMNRLGFSESDIETLTNTPDHYANLNIEWIMSHFACADDVDHPLTKDQAALFTKLAAHFPNAKKSLGNSPGLFRDVQYHTDMVRPGYALYGGNPTPEKPNPMQPVVSLKARILQIRHCKKGESIGYGASHVFEQDTVTATIGVGYADGFLRSAHNQATFYYNNTPCPILGRVSMDLITLDLSQLDQIPVQGDWVEILGANQTIDDLGGSRGTIGYEILTSLGTRYHRHYID